jgi:hypothetical protein
MIALDNTAKQAPPASIDGNGDLVRELRQLANAR